MAKQEQLPPCVRCGRLPAEKDKYCTDCGTPLKNTCCDEPGILGKGCSFVNPPNAAYCAKCGEPTIYQLHGIVTPMYRTANKPASFQGGQ